MTADDQLPATRGELKAERRARRDFETSIRGQLEHIKEMSRLTHEAVDTMLKAMKLEDERHDAAEKANGGH